MAQGDGEGAGVGGVTRRETVERESWALVHEGPSSRDLFALLAQLQGRRVVAAEVDAGDVVDAEAA